MSADIKTNWSTIEESDSLNQPFLQEDGFVFAGRQFVLDCWNATHIDDLKIIEQALHSSATALDLKLLNMHIHKFTPTGRIAGVGIMANAQISINTWPQMHYAAIDIFIGANTNANQLLPVFKHAFHTEKIDINEQLRGRQFTDMTPAAVE